MKYLSRLAALLCAMVLFACGAAAEMLPLAVTADDYLLGADEANEAVTALYEDFMSSSTLEELYVQKMLPAVNGDGLVLMMEFSEAQIAAIAELANELYAKIEEPTQEDIYDLEDCILTLNMLKNGGDATVMYGFDDDQIISGGMSIDKAIDVADKNGGESNWTFKDGTLTINATVTIKSDESLDIIVGSGYANKTARIVAGSALKSNPMIVVENGAHLKIGYSDQNFGSISIEGGIIEVKDGGYLQIGKVSEVAGNAKWKLGYRKNGSLFVYGNIPIKGALAIEGTNASNALVQARETNFTGNNNAHTVTANGKSLFTVYDGASLALKKVTVDGGAVWAAGNSNGMGRSSSLSSGLNNVRIVQVENQTSLTNEVLEFSATDCVFQNAARMVEKDTAVFKFGKYANVKITGGIIQDCQDQSGAGMILQVGSASMNETSNRSMTLNGVTIQRCGAMASSGGIIRTNGVTHTNTTITGCIFDKNYSGGWGNILWNAYGQLNITGSTFTNNTSAKRGGAISSEGQNISITGCTFKNNKAGETGGAVCLFPYTLVGKDEGATELLMNVTIGDGCIFEENEAQKGGAVAIIVQKSDSALSTTVNGTINLGNGYMKNNTATVGGGAIYAGAADTGSGDSLNPKSKVILKIESGSIYGNSAPNGGAIYIDDIRTNNTGINEVIINGGTFGGNGTPNMATTSNGGAVYISDGNFKMTGGTLAYNEAKSNGGAVYVTGGTVTIGTQGSTNNATPELSNNHAANGGAIAVAGSTPVMHCGTLSGNYATDNGGAVYVTGGGFTMSNGTISGNGINNDDIVVTENGGAVYVSGGTFTMDGGTFSGNKAMTNGGAVYVTKSGNAASDFIMKNGTLSGNSATTGGAAYVNGGKFIMNYGAISSNTAAGDGGAAYVTGNGAEFLMYDGSLTGNNAINGGAAYVNGGNFTMISGEMNRNTVKEITDGAAEDGTEGYGGAVCIANGTIKIGVMHCEGSSKGENHNSTIQTIEYTDKKHPVVKDNEAVFGGGLAVRQQGTVYVYCGSVVDNKADNKGTGMNVFMDGENSTFYHYLNSSEIGDEHLADGSSDHGMVSVGGTLTIIHGENNQLVINIKYVANTEKGDFVNVIWTGIAPEGYYLNLPYCPSDWQKEQETNYNKTFVGWAQTQEGTTPEVIRARDNYSPIGTAVEMKDMSENTDTNEMYFYAVWAPKVNTISYAYTLSDDDNSLIMEDTADGKFTHNGDTSYEFEMTGTKEINIGNASMPGYTFKGWRIYANKNAISNWDVDAVVYPRTVTTGTATEYKADILDDLRLYSEYTDYQGVTGAKPGFLNSTTSYLNTDKLTAQQSFGNLTLVAVFEPAYAGLKIMKQGADLEKDPNQTFIFSIVGTRYDTDETLSMKVVHDGNANGVLVNALPVGNYTITEVTDWSWRYDVTSSNGSQTEAYQRAATSRSANGPASVEIEVLDPTKRIIVTFVNERKRTKWLDGSDHKENIFSVVGSSGSTTKALSLDAEEELYFVPTYH